MKDNVITLQKAIMDEKATEYFIKICGFYRDMKKYRSHLDKALQVRDKLGDRISPKAVLSFFDKPLFDGKNLLINNVKFECLAFEQFDPQDLLGIYAYILSAGEFSFESGTMAEAFYADCWGTAYLDAGRDVLRQYIKNLYHTSDVFVSDSFGPGYYGMQVSNLPNFFKILDASKIGVTLYGEQLMVPLKTCAGFYMVSKKEMNLGRDCANCIGNQRGCQFCRSYSLSIKKIDSYSKI